jgi:Collagen triple helix repeat (20 copies)
MNQNKTFTRVSLAFSAAALAVALLGITPLGSAAGTAAGVARESVLGSAAPAGPHAKPKPRVVRGPRGARGPTGPRGPQGPKGEAGPAGAAGAPGERGSQGERGPQGDRGPAGAAIATRVRNVGELKTGSSGYPGVAWSLAGNIWSQASVETQLLFGEVTVRYPDACGGNGTSQPYATIGIFIDGQSFGSAYASFYPGSEGRSQTLGLYFYPSGALISPGANLTHVITVKALDSCTGTGQEFTFESLKIDVVSVS